MERGCFIDMLYVNDVRISHPGSIPSNDIVTMSNRIELYVFYWLESLRKPNLNV